MPRNVLRCIAFWPEEDFPPEISVVYFVDMRIFRRKFSLCFSLRIALASLTLVARKVTIILLFDDTISSIYCGYNENFIKEVLLCLE